MENPAAVRQWIIKRNCSITPRQLLMVYAVLGSVSLSIAIFFTLRGAWYVLGFAVLEMAAVGAAFLNFGRHAADSERLELTKNDLIVTLLLAGKERSFRFNPRTTHIALPRTRDELVGLEDGLAKVAVGRFLDHARRKEFAVELKCCLSASN